MICEYLVNFLGPLKRLFGIANISSSAVGNTKTKKSAGGLCIQLDCFQVILNRFVYVFVFFAGPAEIDKGVCFFGCRSLIDYFLVGSNCRRKFARDGRVNRVEMHPVSRGNRAPSRQRRRQKPFV